MKIHKLKLTWMQILLIIILGMGIFFRFNNLDKKTYWIDEVHTSVRISGYKKTEFVETAPANRIISIEALQKYQRLSSEKGWLDTINALAGNAEHAPLYYLLARLGEQWFGSSITVTRGLAAALSLLAFPSIYWLCLELFASPLVAWIAIALTAVSPLHVLYAQEARQYSLWSAAILLSSAALLRAIRLQTVSSWAIYAATVAMGLYSHLLSILVFIAHGIYLFATHALKGGATQLKPPDKEGRGIFSRYILASMAGFFTLIPWIILYFVNASSVGGWVARKISLLTLIQRWVLNLNAVFLDMQIGFSDRLFDVEAGQDISLNYRHFLIYFSLPILTLVIYSIYFLCRHAPKRVWLFIVTLSGVTALTMALPDIISGGQRSGIARYLIPCYLGIQLAVAHLLASRWQRQFWRIVAIALFTAGVISCTVSGQAETWWNKYSCYYNARVASLVNQAPQPLVISSRERVSRLTSLSYKLAPKVQLLLVEGSNIPAIPDSFSDIFLFRPSGELTEEIGRAQRYKIQPIYPIGHLWKLQK